MEKISSEERAAPVKEAVPSGLFKKPIVFGISMKKTKRSALKPSALQSKAFGDDGDDDDGDDYDVEANAGKVDLHRKHVNAMIKKEGDKAKRDRSSQLVIQKALEEDNQIMQYDEVYEDVSNAQRQREDEESRKRLNLSIKKPKYIKGMMKMAAKRNLESERRYERRAITDRKVEDDQFTDKDKFLTPAYKEKMRKLEEAEQEQSRRDEIDRMQDVTKQQGLSGFYRHYLNDYHGDKRPKLENPEISEVKDALAKQQQVDSISDTHSEVGSEVTVPPTPPHSEKSAILKKPRESPKSPGSSQFKMPFAPAPRHDSSSDSSDSESDASDADSTGQNLSDGSGSDVDGEGGDEETRAFNKKFGLTSRAHPAAPSTTMTKMSMRSKITAGGAGIETEIDYEFQVEKLKCIFKVRNTAEDLAVATREFMQRQAMRDAKGGWAKILMS